MHPFILTSNKCITSLIYVKYEDHSHDNESIHHKPILEHPQQKLISEPCQSQGRESTKPNSLLSPSF